MTQPGSKISNALRNDSFAVSFMYLELRREAKDDYVTVGRKQGRVTG